MISFRRYISTRRYHHGRGSRAGWTFVAHALGDPKLPDAATWEELRAYLAEHGAEQVMLEAANIVWRSYLSHLSRIRRQAVTTALGQAVGIVAKVPAPVATAREVQCASARK